MKHGKVAGPIEDYGKLLTSL